MIDVDSASFLLVMVAASVAAITVAVLPRSIAPPVVVIELLLGILIGPQVLGLAESDDFIQFFSNLGLGLLFFGAEGSRTPAFSDARLELGSVMVSGQSMVVVGTTIALVVIMFLFFERTIIGKALPIGAISMIAVALVALSGVTNDKPAAAMGDALSSFANPLIWLIGVSIMISRGIIKTDNLKMHGVAATVLMDGTADIANESTNLRVVVIPEFNLGTGPLVYGLAVNPVIGIGSYLAQLFLRAPVMKALTYQMQITGPWKSPTITKIDNPPPRQAASAKEK